VAGDPHLAQGGSSASLEAAVHDPEDLLVWMEWYSRFRLLVPFLLVPAGYGVHRLLGTIEFDVRHIVLLSLCTLPITVVSLLLLRRWGNDPSRYGRHLRVLVSTQTIWDISLTAFAVDYAGGPGGPFWPFPFAPVVVASALLPTTRSLLLHSAVALLATGWSAYVLEEAHPMAPVFLALMFLGFSAVITTAVSRRLVALRVQRRELERLHAEKDLAQAVARRREDILAVVSHELASPLMTLRGYVRLLNESKGRDRGSAQLLERIDRQVARLSGLADDLLEMARTSTSAVRLNRTRLDLVEALGDVAAAARLQFPEAEVRVTGAAELAGVWDRDRLEQLFGNLISNALKFAGGRCRIEMTVERDRDGAAHIVVADDGPGISPEALARIFEPFQRYSTERGGLGLGLAIARSIVDLHGGRVWAESPQGRGAAFHVVLPTDAEPSQAQDTNDAESGERPALLGTH
jgi:signal transduction histidine kinase